MINSREMTSKKHSIELFKYFIQFLEIFGAENYGPSIEVNWQAVYNFCSAYGIFDFNDELEEIVYSENEEEFRDKAFAYIEKQVLNGYPVWRLFNMSKWLNDKFEQELNAAETKKDKQYFNKTKCYRCKHYIDHMTTYSKNGYPIHIKPGESRLDENGNPIDMNQLNIVHFRDCSIRKKLIEEQNNGPLKHHSYRRDDFRKFEFKGFEISPKEKREGIHNWMLNPNNLKKCPYFEEDIEMTYEKFISLYFEMYRIQ